MSFAKYNDRIEEENIVIVYLSHDNMHSLKIKRGETHQTRFGAFKHSDLIGVRFGSKIVCNKGWLYILYPTPELWSLAVPHRTQILYSTDISMILLQLDLKPGTVVVEAGRHNLDMPCRPTVIFLRHTHSHCLQVFNC